MYHKSHSTQEYREAVAEIVILLHLLVTRYLLHFDWLEIHFLQQI
jgi:hypothetical protein